MSPAPQLFKQKNNLYYGTFNSVPIKADAWEKQIITYEALLEYKDLLLQYFGSLDFFFFNVVTTLFGNNCFYY